MQMTSHPWLAPSGSLVAKVARGRAMAALRGLPNVPRSRLGPHGDAWSRLLAALPALLRADSGRVLAAVGRVDVLPLLRALADGPVASAPLERALITLWLGIAGHPGLSAPLALPGPFRERVVDPAAPRLLLIGNVRGLVAAAQGPVVIGSAGRLPVDRFVVEALPAVGTTVIVDEHLGVPPPEVVDRVRAALATVAPALRGGRLERVTVGPGAAVDGEARVGPDADAADLAASAHAAFVRVAAAEDPVVTANGAVLEQGQRVALDEVLARACGNAVALPWRADRTAAARAVVGDIDDLEAISDPTPSGAEVLRAVRALAGETPPPRRRALLVNVDADDFVYSFQFGRSVERRCVERGLRVDRVAIDPGWRRDLAGELGGPIPPPIADGIEMLGAADDDPALVEALQRLSTRRYEVVVANVRPRLFYDLVATGLLRAPTLLWDRHLHDGLHEERLRRGLDATHVQGLPLRGWSLQGVYGPDLHQSLIKAGLGHGCGRQWPMDLDFFQSDAIRHPDRLFAGGDSGRDWALLVEAVRNLPLDVHLVTREAPVQLPPHVRVEARLPLYRFRDAMAAATITAIPLLRGAGASGLTVLTMAMALGVAVVGTESTWMTQYVTDGEDALLVPAGDVAAFRDALVRVHEDTALRARLVDNARRRVAAICDLEAFTREMFATLD